MRCKQHWRVIYEHELYVIEAKNLVFDDDLRQDMCSGGFAGV